jgi:hypothetical protein
MSTLESWMPQDLEIANRYVDKARVLRSILAESRSEPLVSLADVLTRATVQFGRCELHMHVADRNAALKSNAAIVASKKKRAMDHHARGLQELASAKPDLARFIDGVSPDDEQQALKAWKGMGAGIKASWLEALGDLDMKPSDAEKLNVVMEECCAAAETGLKSLGRHIAKQFDELERLRKTPTRGTESNWPYWKLVAVAIWLGFTVAGVILALQRGAQWWDVAMIILIGLIGTLLIAFGC